MEQRMRNKLSATLLIGALAFMPVPSHAQEMVPGDACTAGENGRFKRTGGPELSGAGHFLVCDGVNWQRIFSYNASGVVIPQFVTPGDCGDGNFLTYDAATGGMKCAELDFMEPTWVTDGGTLTTIDLNDTLSAAVEATDDSGSVTYSKVSGDAWISVASDGTLLGTAPGSPETSSVTVQASDESGNTVNRTFDISVASSCPTPGDTCSDGSVFAGDTNLYVTNVNLDTSVKWKTYSGAFDINPNSETDGQANHENRSGTLSSFPAFELCENLGRHGHTDWYLPAKDELNTLYINSAAIGGFISAELWSSTESSTHHAWYQRFSDGLQSYQSKVYGYAVRCVRRN